MNDFVSNLTGKTSHFLEIHQNPEREVHF